MDWDLLGRRGGGGLMDGATVGGLAQMGGKAQRWQVQNCEDTVILKNRQCYTQEKQYRCLDMGNGNQQLMLKS